MHRTSGWLTAVALVLLPTTSPPLQAKDRWEGEPDLSGTYTITSGTLPDGTAYDGTVEIEGKTRAGGKRGMVVWAVTWKITGKDPIHGFGVNVDGAFFVTYGDGESYGLMVYAPIQGGRDRWMKPDDMLRGVWVAANGANGGEGLRGNTGEWRGTYPLHGHSTAPDGSFYDTYKGRMTLEKDGEIFHAKWTGAYDKKDKPFDYDGLGFEAPGFLALTWGGGVVGVYVINEDGTMTGMYGEKAGIGNEKLAK
ncbi:MAG TPA: hypothetical protein VJ826_15510 [Candidatus Polarisedimenticolaceae bacterium]|nr:hypothetical protein [Candidatus Polarisedimenticolaceae bacterium]